MKAADKISRLKAGLKGFCENNGFSKVMLGLSGGMDSAFAAVLACQTLGAENVHALMMDTKYTLPDSLDIARDMARHYGFKYQEINIDSLVDAQAELLRSAFGQPVKGIVLENLQARIRGQILMAYSNQFGNLVLACGNKSEIAMGYCTLYGDTCGGLAPIGDVYKTDLYRLAKSSGWYFPADVLTRAPSAELAFDQKDQDSLPPYPVLDGILEQLLDHKKPLDEIVKKGYERNIVRFVAARHEMTRFKRLQLPPVIKLNR